MNYTDPDNVPSEWQIGDVILNKYEVREVFEGGGMGLVYRVYHREWNMELAVKSPRSEFFETSEQVANFEREAETWVNLGMHPHIVSCYYVRRLGGIPRIFAEYIEGGTLADWIRGRRLYEGTPSEVWERLLDVAIQVARGLHCAHEKGLVHQDVKPANVLISLSGAAKINDFGLARARCVGSECATSEWRPSQTMLSPGSGFLTKEYASPEQFKGELLTRRSDIWSWALLVLEMIKGECDWSDGRVGAHVADTFFEHSDVNYKLRELLLNCLKSDPMERPINAAEVERMVINVWEIISGRVYQSPRITKIKLTAAWNNNHALSFIDLGNIEAARSSLESALDVDSDNAAVIYNLGLMTSRYLGSGIDTTNTKLAWLASESASTMAARLKHIFCMEHGCLDKDDIAHPALTINRFQSNLNNVSKPTCLLPTDSCEMLGFGLNDHTFVWLTNGKILMCDHSGAVVSQLSIPSFIIASYLCRDNNLLVLCTRDWQLQGWNLLYGLIEWHIEIGQPQEVSCWDSKPIRPQISDVDLKRGLVLLKYSCKNDGSQLSSEANITCFQLWCFTHRLKIGMYSCQVCLSSQPACICPSCNGLVFGGCADGVDVTHVDFSNMSPTPLPPRSTILAAFGARFGAPLLRFNSTYGPGVLLPSGADGLTLLDPHEGNVLQFYRCIGGCQSSIATNGNGTVIVGTSPDHKLSVWRSDSTTPIVTFDVPNWAQPHVSMSGACVVYNSSTSNTYFCITGLDLAVRSHYEILRPEQQETVADEAESYAVYLNAARASLANMQYQSAYEAV